MTKLICLMPTYNKEKTVAKAIESVLMQKTNFDYKLIILDDCSTDGSNYIVKEYQKEFPDKIEIIRNETNLKLLNTIIKGYKKLKGADYFCVLDADDWYTYDKKFADAVQFLDKHKNYSMYMTNILLKKADGEELYYKENKEIFDFGFYERTIGKAIFIQTSGVIYRNVYFKNGHNKLFENVVNLKFPESYRADGFRAEWYLQAGKAHFVNHVESVYNYDENGLWSQMTKCEQILNYAKVMYSCAEFFPKKEKFYKNQCKLFFGAAMLEFYNLDKETFNKNKKVISFLYNYLCKTDETITIKILKLLVNLIPIKSVRKRIRKGM